MHFVRADLKPYAQPVEAGDLQLGCVYYLVNFCDEAMKTPIIETVVYLGTDPPAGYREAVEAKAVFFQDHLSFSLTEDDSSSPEDQRFFEFQANELGNVFAFEDALDVLIRCSLRINDSES